MPQVTNETASESLLVKLLSHETGEVAHLNVAVTHADTGARFTPVDLVPSDLAMATPDDNATDLLESSAFHEPTNTGLGGGFLLQIHVDGGTVVCQQAPPPAPPGTMICKVVPINASPIAAKVS